MTIKNKKRALQLSVLFLMFFAFLIFAFTSGTQTLLDNAKPDIITDSLVRADIEKRAKEHFGEMDAILLKAYERHGDIYGIVAIAGNTYFTRMNGDTIIDSGRY